MSATTALSICNGALAMIGENAVAAGDGSKGWTVFNALWENNILAPILSMFPWNALKQRVTLYVPSAPISSASFASSTNTVTLTFATSYSVSAATWANNSITFTIGTHGLQIGQYVTIAGVSPTGYNATYQITSVTSTQIVVTNTTNPGSYVSGGTVTWTTTNWQVGQTITVYSVSPVAYNGSFTVTAATSNTVSYVLGGNPGAYVSGGYMTWQPLFDWLNVYALPPDYVRAIQVDMINVSNYYGWGFGDFAFTTVGMYMPPYKIEGDYLLSNESQVSLLYVQDQDPPTDPVLVDLLTVKAAVEMCYALTRDRSLKDDLQKIFEGRYIRAKGINSAQGTPDDFQESSWIQARF